MTEFKGTKGKWVVKYLDDIFIENEFGEQICEMPAKGIIRYETWRENALLISKSPEMLSMLERCFSMCDKLIFPTEQELKDISIDIKQLIKEATEL